MAMFRKIVARSGYVDFVRARLAKGIDTDLLVADAPDDIIDDVVEAIVDDFKFSSADTLPSADDFDWYDIEKFDESTGEYIVIGWQFVSNY